MKTRLAIIEGQRREAEPGLKAECPVCDQAMIAKCGELRVWHWSHRVTRKCDKWWEPETEWHRAWKDNFPRDWQEIVHRSEKGEKHIADVKTENGVVLEFQHSHLHREERESRETFYQNMVWVVDGLRRLRDRPKFFKALGNAQIVNANPLTAMLASDEGALLRDWSPNRKAVFFDFGETTEPSDALQFDVPVLWLLHPGSTKGRTLLVPLPKANFVNTYLRGQPLTGLDVSSTMKRVLVPRPPILRRWKTHRPQRPLSFRDYLARKQRARARTRL